MPRWTLWFSIFIFLALPARADVALGAGVSSETSGRVVPALNLAVLGKSFGLSAFSTGVKTTLYYESGYVLSALYLWQPGEILSGPVTAGLGLGFYYSKRGYRPGPSAALEEDEDSTGGPSFRAEWKFLGPFYLSAECLFGLRTPINLLVLSAQDVAHLTFGVRF